MLVGEKFPWKRAKPKMEPDGQLTEQRLQSVMFLFCVVTVRDALIERVYDFDLGQKRPTDCKSLEFSVILS
jgi:hypothetical protein